MRGFSDSGKLEWKRSRTSSPIRGAGLSILRGRSIETALAIVLLAACAAPSARGADGAITVAEYGRLLERQRDSIRSMIVKYHEEFSFDQGVVSAGLFPRRVLAEDATFAFSGIKRYSLKFFREVDPKGKVGTRTYKASWDGRVARKRENNHLTLQSRKPNYADLNAYTNALRWPMTDEERAIAGKEVEHQGEYLLPDMFRSPAWKFKPGTELVDGVRCVVLEDQGGARSLWLDPARGYAMLRVVQRDPSPSADCTCWTTTFHDFTEAAPGLFLPRRIEGVTEHVRKGGEPLGAVRITLSVDELRINAVPDSIFDLEPLVGEMVVDGVNAKVHYHLFKGSPEAVDHHVERAMRLLGVPQRYALYKRMAWAGLAGGLVLVALVVYSLVTRYTAKRAES